MNNKTQALSNGTWVCQAQKGSISKGFFFGDNPLNFPTTILYVQLSISALLTSFLQFILNPLGESTFTSQMLVGIILGPSVLGGGNVFADTVFPMKSFYISETFAFFGVMFFLFLVGVKMDISVVKQTGRKALVIGISAFFVPLILNMGFALVLQRTVTMEPKLHKSIIIIAVFQCMSSFHVIACLLADLKLLNSEIGRLAVSSSMVSGVLSFVLLSLAFTTRQSSIGRNNFSLPFMGISMFCMFILTVYIMRPIMLWMVAQTHKGKPFKGGYICYIFIMVMSCSLIGEVMGLHFMLGPMILGLAVPEGPPLGSALVEKLDSYISLILLPSYFVFSAARINFSLIKMKTVWVVELLTVSSFCGKLIGTVVPSLYCKMPAVDAFSLGLIMSAQGIIEVITLQHGLFLKLIDEESFSIMALSALVSTAIITPVVKFLYDPSKRYMSTMRRRTIEHALPNVELRMLACIYQEDSTPPIINLLEVSNPTPKTPICFYVVHLIRLSGRTAPVLITHRAGKRRARNFESHDSDRIVNAFRLYEEHSSGGLIMNALTAISPYATMHDDVCTLALEKRTSMVLIPFHKQFNELSGSGVLDNNPIRSVNRNILQNSPCSVGILLDRGTLNTNVTISCKTLYNFGMIFVEGPDDREALAYAMRMAEHPNVSLTVVRLVDHNMKHSVHRDLDMVLISKCKIAIAGRKQHVYKEEHVRDSVDMINAIRSNSMENLYDLILVGRRHDSNSPLFMGLTEWNEFPELGFIGDMLASSDSNCNVSVLVVQQQMLGSDRLMVSDSSFKSKGKEGSFSIVDMPRDDRVHPVDY
ncbi:unnamed protein product [Prunus armeniaca]